MPGDGYSHHGLIRIMLAYIFWHIPREGGHPEEYERMLTAFHETLSARPPDGFRGSTVFRHYALPWAPQSLFVYEDWYLLDDFAALGVLNDAATRDPHRVLHDAAAERSKWGAGGVYRALEEDTRPEGDFSYWLSKPDGMGYEAFYDEIGEAARKAMWRRQLVLGPAPEFCVLAASRMDRLNDDEIHGFESSGRIVCSNSRS